MENIEDNKWERNKNKEWEKIRKTRGEKVTVKGRRKEWHKSWKERRESGEEEGGEEYRIKENTKEKKAELIIFPPLH